MSHSRNKSLASRDLKHIWHPFTQMTEMREFPPLEVAKAKGGWVYDTSGKRYFDAVSSWWVSVLGHNHPKIASAIAKQARTMDQVIFANATHEGAVEVAERVVASLPSKLTKVFFSDNGSTAVEVALKMALQYHAQTGNPQKTKILSLEDGYHGDTLGAMSVGETGYFFKAFKPLLFHSPKLKDWAKLETFIEKYKDTAAAFIVEPLLQAAGGMNIYAPTHLKKLQTLCRKHNILVIYDEIATGFGRTGTMYAMDQAKTSPDFVCLSKGLTGGTLPVSVTVTTNKVFKAFEGPYSANKTFFHGHSYTANPIGCAASVACLRIFQEEHVMEQVQENAAYFAKVTRALNDDKYPIGNYRQLGFVAAYDMIDTRRSKQAKRHRLSPWFTKRALEEGLLIRPLGNVLYFWPPINSTRREIDFMIDKTCNVLRSMKD